MRSYMPRPNRLNVYFALCTCIYKIKKSAGILTDGYQSSGPNINAHNSILELGLLFFESEIGRTFFTIIYTAKQKPIVN